MTKVTISVPLTVELDLTVELRDMLVERVYRQLRNPENARNTLTLYSTVIPTLKGYARCTSDQLGRLQDLFVRCITEDTSPSELNLGEHEYTALRILAKGFDDEHFFKNSKEFFLSVFYLALSERFQDHAKEFLMVGEAYDELVNGQKDT